METTKKTIPVELFHQTDDSRCGPACLKMILRYYGQDISEQEIYEKVGCSWENGCTTRDMAKYAASLGYNVFIKENCTIQDLKHYIDQGTPVIIDWFSPAYDIFDNSIPDGHSSIVVGVDVDYVHILDPLAYEIRSVLHRDFMRVWFDWENDPYIKTWESMVLRQILVITQLPIETWTDSSTESPIATHYQHITADENGY